MFGTVFALILLLFYVVFLIRLAPCYGDTVKVVGGFWGRFTGAFFLVYVIMAMSFLLSLLGDIVPKALVTGIPGKWISLTALLVCCVGTHRGMQKRGRMAEVSGVLLLWGILLMLAVCISQGKGEYLSEILKEKEKMSEDFFRSGYVILCGFSALGLMPFLLEDVEKQGSAGKTAILGILTLGGILIGAELILPAVLGMGRLQTEKYPVLPLLFRLFWEWEDFKRKNILYFLFCQERICREMCWQDLIFCGWDSFFTVCFLQWEVFFITAI